MSKSDKDPSKGTSFWGMVFSIALHASVIVLILFWGFRGASEYSGSKGPIQVSLSSLDTGGGNNAPARKAQPKKVEKKAPPKKVEKKEVQPPPEPPEKKEPEEEIKKVEKKQEPEKEPEKKEEPKKEEKKKEEVKKEPEKKDVIPLEPEKKEEPKKVEKKKEEPKKEEKKKEEKKVAEKPKPTEKPKPKKEEKKVDKKKLEKERSRVLKDIQRQKVLDQLGSSEDPEEPEEPMGEEQKLAMADAEDAGLETTTESSEPRGGSSGGTSVSPVIVNLYSQQVHRKISRNWRIPPSVPTDGGLATDLLFKVGEDGKIYDVRVNESSGNPVFDEYCVNAIYKSAPLPPPPAELRKEAKSKGIVITFRNDP